MSLYDIKAYGAMIADATRFEAYLAALRHEVQAGAVVLDLGTGTGIHALIACQLGARLVYAIEPSDAIQLAREIARDNGFDDRVVFIQDVSTRVTLPEPADVMVSDMRGVLPLFGRHIPSIADARRRLLRPGGTVIPQSDEMWAAPVEAPDLYEEIVGQWAPNDAGVDMTAGRRLATQERWRRRIEPGQLIGLPQAWARLDYTSIEEPNASGVIESEIERPGRVHGIAVWFDATLADGIGFSNAPGADDLIYGMNFLPLPAAVTVTAGDSVCVEIQANLVGDDYIWRWDTEVRRGGDSQDEPTRFSQSSFHGATLSPDSLRRAAVNHVPRLTEDGFLDQAVLELIDGTASLGKIADTILERFPESFRNREDAINRVASLTRRYAG